MHCSLDVIFSVTQGKFNLLPLNEMEILAVSGDLYSEISLQNLKELMMRG